MQQTQETRTQLRPGELAQAIFAALDNHDLDRQLSYAADDLVDEFLALGMTVSGRADIKQFFGDVVAAFPDFHIKPRRVHEAGDVAVVEWDATGTFNGEPWQGVNPTGKPVHIRGLDVMEFSDGLLHRNTIYMDGAEVGRELGVLPPMNSRQERLFKQLANVRTAVGRRIAERRAGKTSS